nr:WAT1-related protein At3g28050-like isoform X1 [Quercus suber]POE96001.1 wat1-related protein [Quercus suber]
MWGLGVTAITVAVEFFEVGLTTLSKAAMRKGMSNFVFIVYSNALAILFLLSSSLIFYRKRTCPRLTFSVFCRMFLLGVLSCCVQSFMYFGIGYSSPTLASAMTDLTPAFTFILAILSRMEKLDFRLRSSLAKSIGTMVSIAGALMVTLYKGPPITFAASPHNLHYELHASAQSNWLIGGLLLVAACFCFALLLIVQTWIMKEYPAVLMQTLICCIIVTIQIATVSLVAEKDPNAWRLRPDIELIAIGYSALFGIAIRSVVHTWACNKKGPVYVSLFKPLGIVIALVMGVAFLGDTLYLGSVVGAAVIATGFYSVIWGKAQEEKRVEDTAGISDHLGSFASNVPLLQNKSMRI